MDVGHESAYDSYNQTNLGLGGGQNTAQLSWRHIISQREAVPRMAYHFKAVKGGRGSFSWSLLGLVCIEREIFKTL